MNDGLRPVRLPANQPPRFYRGGAAIAALRGDEPSHGSLRKLRSAEFGPEDWVASCTTLHGERSAGLTTLPDGTLLRDAVAAHPANWLGDAHVRTFGTEPALLVKLLDAGQRLPVHCHPSNEFAARHFGSRYGKTEAWIVVGAAEGASVHIGFREEPSQETVAGWVARQDAAAMLAALNPVTVRPGDAVFVPAGVPHAIDAGIFIVELQQPTDLSVTLEWQGFLDDEAGGHLGVGFQTALGCVDRRSWADRLDELVHRSARGELFGHPEFFRAERLAAGARLGASFGVLVVLSGTGTLRTEKAGDVPLTKGATFALPHAAGESMVDGDVVAIRCLPPVA
jgi:mannose-6-phosphate isomerase